MNNLTNQQKGSLMAFVAIMFITPDSLLIRLSNIDTWGMLFYRGAIPFLVVLIGLVFFVLVSTSVSSYLLEYSDRLSSNYSFTYGYELVVSFVVLGTIFTLMFSILSDAIIHWKPAVLGGVFTAFLFSIGKTIIGYTLTTMHIDSIFGSASVLTILILVLGNLILMFCHI